MPLKADPGGVGWAALPSWARVGWGREGWGGEGRSGGDWRGAGVGEIYGVEEEEGG